MRYCKMINNISGKKYFSFLIFWWEILIALPFKSSKNNLNKTNYYGKIMGPHVKEDIFTWNSGENLISLLWYYYNSYKSIS